MKTPRYVKITAVLLAGGAWRLGAQTAVDLTRQSRLETGTLLPARCAVGQIFFKSDTTSLSVCSGADTWKTASVQSGTAANRPVNCVLGQLWLATDSGAVTYCSTAGNPGTWSASLAGPAGPQGPAGATGASGNTVLNGSGAPPAGTGNNGDFYLRNDNSCLYGPRTSGAWPGTCTLLVGPAGATGATGSQGPQGVSGAPGVPGSAGANGNTVLSGTGLPSSGTGNNGDWYINTTTSCLYGPKASGTWSGSCTYLIGLQGSTGATGPAGQGVPTGGTSGQVLSKIDSTDYHTHWVLSSGGSSANYAPVGFSANPNFLVASSTSPQTFGMTLTGNVTSSTLDTTNATPGQQLIWIYTQDTSGGRTVSHPANLLHACTVSGTPNVRTMITAVFDGSNAYTVDCTADDAATLISGPTRTAPATPASGLAVWFDSTANTLLVKDLSGNVYAATKTVSARTANQFVTYTDTGGVAHTASVALADLPSGVTQTIASGTSALGTGAIPSAACAPVVTTTATGTATTDSVIASFNADPTAVTGYIPLTSGMLTIIAYPTSNSVNFKVCNNTSSSVTPGAITLNWRVVR